MCEPFLIMELNRFVPYLEDKCVKFHPLNMPYIKIGKIEIMGFVISVSEDIRFYEYQGKSHEYKYATKISKSISKRSEKHVRSR